MKGFSFDSFVVHDTNQAAYDICNKLATLEKDVPRPIVLLGESGSGKSHLLWAIVNHFREENIKVGVAIISSKDFPNKVKELPQRPDKLQKKHPVILIVDELHLFEKDQQELEQVMLAFQEHNQIVVAATNIHPSILPGFSGKLKSYLNNGVIVGIKPLPKSANAPVPEAATKQIASLKARIAELEKEKSAPAANANADGKIKALQEELERVAHERDVARAALDRSEGELIDVRNELARLREPGQASDESVDAIVERVRKQKEIFIERIAALEKQVEELMESTRSLGDEGDGLTSEKRRAANEQAAAQEESELLRLIDGIRESIKQYEDAAAEDDEKDQQKGSAQNILATIAEQLKAIEEKASDAEKAADDMKPSEEPNQDGENKEEQGEDADAANAADKESS